MALLAIKYSKNTMECLAKDRHRYGEKADKSIQELNLTTAKKKTGLFAKMRRMAGYMIGIGIAESKANDGLRIAKDRVRDLKNDEVNRQEKVKSDSYW